MSKRKLAMADVTEAQDETVPADFQTPQEAAAAANAGNSQDTPESNPATDDSNTPPTADDTPPTDTPDEQQEEDQSNSPAVLKAKREYLKKVARHGADRGLGGKALVMFAKTVVEGASQTVLKASDAKALYEAFKKGAEKTGTLAEAPNVVPDSDVAFGEASTKDAKNKSFDAQVSKLKRFLKFGYEYRNAETDSNEIISDAIATHIGMIADRVENIKYRSTYAALYELCGEQMKDEHAGVAMTKEEMFDFFLGKEPKAKTGLDLVKAALENANRALKGKASTDNQEGREAVSSANLEAAIDSLRETINELDPSGKTLQDIDAKAKKAAEKAMVQQFRDALRNPPTIETTYRLIKGEHSSN